VTGLEIVRLAVCVAELCALPLLWLGLHPTRRSAAAAFLASGWVLACAALAGILVSSGGSRSFPSIFGTPADLLLSRVLLGGFFVALCFPAVSLFRLYFFALACDLANASLANVELSVRHLPLHALVVAIYFLPAQLFSRWTRQDRNLYARACLHIVFHSGLLLGVLPALIVACGGGNWNAPFARSSFANKLYLQLLLIPAVLLISSLQEFARRGHGTPMPADPPQRLVTSGPYAYVANPMQIGKFLVVLGWGFFWWSPWITATAFLGLLYSVAIASPREDREMTDRFGHAWGEYRQRVRRWWPRWKPGYGSEDTSAREASSRRRPVVARLYLQLECGPCRQMAEWMGRQAPVGLEILPIEDDNYARITYDPGDGAGLEQGIVALARALEHLNLALAFFGWMIRLPGIAQLAQVLADSFDPQKNFQETACALPASAGVTLGAELGAER